MLATAEGRGCGWSESQPRKGRKRHTNGAGDSSIEHGQDLSPLTGLRICQLEPRPSAVAKI